MRTQVPLWLGLLSISILVACSAPKPVTQYPLGPFSATGTIVQSEFSLIRRGSHGFIPENQGTITFYVESKNQNLGDFVDKVVHVDGKLEANTRPEDPPVLVVAKITASKADEQAMRRWNLQQLGLTISVPEEWKLMPVRKNASGTVVFIVPTGDEDMEVLALVRTKGGEGLPQGTPLQIAGFPGIRYRGADGKTETILLQRGPQERIQMKFARTTGDGALEDATLAAILRSVSFGGVSSSSKTDPGQSGSGTLGIPCGGVAGVLCPAGQYCDIVDRENGIGRCHTR